MSEINLYNLSIDELKEQARILGIAIRGNPSADTLREKIRQAVNIEPAESSKPADVDDSDRKKDWITIVISEDENDQQPVYVGVNGKSYFIRRGEPVAVPPEVVGVLSDAKQTVPTGKDGAFKTIQTYPFSIEK
tara:strand:- start:10 stop:411 length:402 start_codon:yes stop_codon:yes gene_type:complete